MKKRLFIAFEGGEGAGKSTILDKIYDWMKDENIPCIKTREPGGIKISEQIRSVILDNNNTEMDERTEALLYVAARRQHLVEKIISALNEGKVVLCDRFIDYSLDYQGYARGIGMDEILEINKFAIGEYMPNLSIFFDLDPGEGLKRINKDNNREVNRLDNEKLDFHNKVREGYYKILEKDKDRIVKIDASKSIDKVYEDVKYIIRQWLDK